MLFSKSFYLGLLVSLVLGTVGGAIPGFVAEPAFESTAQFEAKLVAPEAVEAKFKAIEDAVDVRHDRLIVGMNIIDNADGEFKLTALKCF